MKDCDAIYSTSTFKGLVHILFDDDDNEPMEVYTYDDLWDLFPDDWVSTSSTWHNVFSVKYRNTDSWGCFQFLKFCQ